MTGVGVGLASGRQLIFEARDRDLARLSEARRLRCDRAVSKGVVSGAPALAIAARSAAADEVTEGTPAQRHPDATLAAIFHGPF